MMKYYRNKNNEVYAFELDGSQDQLIKPDMIAMTASEVEAHAIPPVYEKTIQQQIDELEGSITERNKREYVKGLKYPTDERFFYSVKKIDKVDADIELLRAEL